MYYIIKSPGNWTVYDAQAAKPRKLDDSQIELLKELFPKALRDGYILDALTVAPISASKLQQLTTASPVPKDIANVKSKPNPETPNK